MNMKFVLLTLFMVASTLTSFANAEDDDTKTDAAAVDCEACHADQAINDPLTMDSRQKRRDQAVSLTGEGTGKATDEQGTSTGQ